MHRLFAALPIPDDIAGQLSLFQDDLPGASWRPTENFHITLCFYGELSGHEARDLDELLGAIDFNTFDLMLEGAGWFGRRQPTAVWARVRESDELRGLASACERAARQLGIRLERRPFTPHITLAYLHGTPPDTARSWTETHHTFRAGPFPATHFHLYESRPRRIGPSRYEPVADYPLRGAFTG
jgi:2'-5' RNA ligase